MLPPVITRLADDNLQVPVMLRSITISHRSIIISPPPPPWSPGPP